jgi:hypothetical protein
VALVGGRDPSDYWIFPDGTAADGAVSFGEEDLVGLHEQMLGRRGAAVVAEHAAGGVDVSALDAVVLQRLERGGTIRATFNGLVGDCAWGAPFWYGDEPMGFLLMDGASHDRLVASELEYRAALCNRQLVRVVPRPTIADATYGMGAFVGIDGRRLLPPRPSNTRGDDVIFARLLWMCAPEALYGHLPRTLVHAPVDTRRFWPGELFRTARGFDLTKLILACVGGADIHPGPAEDRDRMRALGRHLVDVGSLASDEFDRYVRDRMVCAVGALAAKAHALVRAHGGEPRYWADDVSRYLDLQFESLARDDYYVPLDLLRGRTPDEARALGQRLVRGLGELMCWWPDVTELARGWRASGRRLAARL